MNIIGVLNEGCGREVLEERCGLYYLNKEGKKKITYVRRQIDEFLSDTRNIVDYLVLVNHGPKSEYEFDESIMEAVKSRKRENKFIDFLSHNSEKIMDIARTTGHTGALIVTEMSIYIRQYCLDKGYISAENRMWKVNKEILS